MPTAWSAAVDGRAVPCLRPSAGRTGEVAADDIQASRDERAPAVSRAATAVDAGRPPGRAAAVRTADAAAAVVRPILARPAYRVFQERDGSDFQWAPAAAAARADVRASDGAVAPAVPDLSSGLRRAAEASAVRSGLSAAGRVAVPAAARSALPVAPVRARRSTAAAPGPRALRRPAAGQPVPRSRRAARPMLPQALLQRLAAAVSRPCRPSAQPVLRRSRPAARAALRIARLHATPARARRVEERAAAARAQAATAAGRGPTRLQPAAR